LPAARRAATKNNNKKHTHAHTKPRSDWEFSWLARNLAPVRGQKIHWASEPGSSSGGAVLDISNNGAVRFARRGPGAVAVRLTISYEVPGALAPFASVESLFVFCLCCPPFFCFGVHRLSSFLLLFRRRFGF